MYHEQKIIDGKLCWRGTPKGEWIEYTAEQLTTKLTEKKQEQEQEQDVVYEKAPWWANPNIKPPIITC